MMAVGVLCWSADGLLCSYLQNLPYGLPKSAAARLGLASRQRPGMLRPDHGGRQGETAVAGKKATLSLGRRPVAYRVHRLCADTPAAPWRFRSNPAPQAARDVRSDNSLQPSPLVETGLFAPQRACPMLAEEFEDSGSNLSRVCPVHTMTYSVAAGWVHVTSSGEAVIRGHSHTLHLVCCTKSSHSHTLTRHNEGFWPRPELAESEAGCIQSEAGCIHSCAESCKRLTTSL
eukprot:TRINITY_DN4322_c0_g1_i1.p1 TRINITY_DN4322_c0_g1~~TRINITY_DN4322_c0_g1_i1.p1  ORF type:complete len:253 (-),score=5.72 TRINITY_DN4322_c0_g1_i1:130-822(-)